nr:hypothetical protein [Tanacetum cinerariifolium]
MVNTRTDAKLAAAIQNTLQTLLPQIRAEIREEFRTGSGPLDSGGNPPPERLKREYHSISQTNTETSTEFMQRFPRLAGFLGAAAGTAKEQAKNFQNSGNGRDQRKRGQQSNRPVNSGFQQSKGPSEGYSYLVCTTCGRRHPGECRRAAGTCFKCGQTGHLQKDCKKNTAASTSGQADKKPVHRVVFLPSLKIMLLRPQ